MKYIPVDHDPFASVDLSPRYMPVDHDPFSNDSSTGHYAGITARAVVNGMSSLPTLAADAPLALGNGAINAYNYLNPKDQFKHKFEYLSPDQSMDDIGIDKPDTAGQRLYSDVVGGLSGARSMVGGGASGAPALQYASGTLGAGAGGVTREAGGSPTAQLMAALVGGSLPSAAPVAQNITRSVLQGGEEGAKNVASNIDAFKAAGTTPTVGQATKSAIAKAIESTLEKIPGSDSIIAQKAVQQQQEMGGELSSISQNLSPNASGTKTGRLIKSGINDFKDNFKNKQGDLYDILDSKIDPSLRTPLTNYKTALNSATSIDPLIPNQSSGFVNQEISTLADNLDKDLALSKPFMDYGPNSNGTLAYQSVPKIRSSIGEKIDSPSLVSTTPQKTWKSLYGSLSDDIKSAALESGSDTLQAWNRANNYTRAGMQRLDTLNDIVNSGTPEQVYQAALSGTKEGATTINQVMRSLPDEGKKAITSTVVKRMGLATPGNQSDLGDSFSTNTFLTNWNRLSPEAKGTLFGAHGKEFSDNMDKIASVADNLKFGSKIYANPSGTAHASSNLAVAAAAVLRPIRVGLGMLGVNRAAKFMTNPNTVRWLAQTVNKPTNFLPAQIQNLAQWAEKNGDTDTLEAATKMQNAMDSENSKTHPERDN